MTGNQRLTADDIRKAIERYGRTIVMPSAEQMTTDITVSKVATAKRPTLAATFPLWTLEEGRSDLSVEITIIETWPGLHDLEIDNIRVL
jgi:hypothetical protein